MRYEEYEIWVEERGLQSAVSDKAVVSSAPPQKAKAQPAPAAPKNKSLSNEETQKLKKAKKLVDELENTISKLEEQKAETEVKLAEPSVYNDAKALADLNRTYAEITQKLEKANGDWETAMLEVEELAG